MWRKALGWKKLGKWDQTRWEKEDETKEMRLNEMLNEVWIQNKMDWTNRKTWDLHKMRSVERYVWHNRPN